MTGSDRTSRLEAALRRNLSRRKEQQRGRATQEPTPAGDDRAAGTRPADDEAPDADPEGGRNEGGGGDTPPPQAFRSLGPSR